MFSNSCNLSGAFPLTLILYTLAYQSPLICSWCVSNLSPFRWFLLFFLIFIFTVGMFSSELHLPRRRFNPSQTLTGTGKRLHSIGGLLRSACVCVVNMDFHAWVLWRARGWMGDGCMRQKKPLAGSPNEGQGYERLLSCTTRKYWYIEYKSKSTSHGSILG
ncbi:hypothetical protein DFH27DRAFT_306326 [Peziza echinospora]|nr:hypothetical protein DFH27DRAFT_306326 [Peziza echinospora]